MYQDNICLRKDRWEDKCCLKSGGIRFGGFGLERALEADSVLTKSAGALKL